MITRFCLLAASVCILSASATADWINLTGAETAPNIAEIYILDDHVKLVLEVYIGDLETFDDLVPDDWLQNANAERPEAAERLKRFSEETFRFIDEKGNKLQYLRPETLGLAHEFIRAKKVGQCLPTQV